MGEAISEKVEQYIREEIEEDLNQGNIEDALEEEIALRKWEAEKIAAEQFAAKLEPLLEEIEEELESRGYDTDDPVVQNAAKNSLLSVVTGDSEPGETVEMPIAGRENGSTEFTMLPSKEPPTKTVEVPIEGGDVEDPDTVEKEVLDPDMSQLVSGETLEEWADRHNVGSGSQREDQESGDEEIPKGGLPWYQ